MPGTTKTVSDAIQEGLQRTGARFTSKDVLDAALSRPRIKALILQEGSEGAFLRRFGHFCHLMGDQMDDVLAKNFTQIFDEKLIITGADGKLFDWGDDFLRCFRHNPAEFRSRPAVTSLDQNGKAYLKQFLSGEDAGDMWKLPEWPDPHEKYWIRGLVGELEMLHKKYERTGYTHIPSAPPAGVDFQDIASKVSVQVKTVQTVNVGAITRMKNAIISMLDTNNVPGDHALKLEVLLKPDGGSAEAAMKTALQTFLDGLEDRVGSRVTLDIREHVFGQ